MALPGHGAMSDLSPLSGVKRKLDFGAVRSAFDPGCVKTCLSQECAELFSQFPSLDRTGKCNWFSHRQNREGISTRKLNVRVFTQPGPTTDMGSTEWLIAILVLWLRFKPHCYVARGRC